MSDFDRLLEAVRSHDVVVAQRLPPQLLRYVARLPVRFVADLYNPQMIEVLEAMGDAEGGSSAAAGLALDAGPGARWPTSSSARARSSATCGWEGWGWPG